MNTMKTQHTPGPWQSAKDFLGPDTYGDGNAIPIFPENGGVAICEVVAVNGDGLSRPHVQAMAEANARLTAAAPELLEALRESVETLHHYITQSGYTAETIPAYRKAKAAIVIAT